MNDINVHEGFHFLFSLGRVFINIYIFMELIRYEVN